MAPSKASRLNPLAASSREAMTAKPSSDSDSLRRAAEARLQERPAASRPQSNAELQQRQHELEVHQIELELQNEEVCRTQAESEAGLERYTELFDFAPVGYLELDADGAIRHVNFPAARLVGLECAELLGRRFQLFVAETDQTVFNDFLARVFAAGAARQTCELTLAGKGGLPLVVRVEATLSPDNQQCRAMLTDITEQKRAEEALRTSERRFRTLIENSYDAIALFGADGAVLYASPSITKILGYLPEEVCRRNALEFVRDDWQEAVKERLGESLRRPGVDVFSEAYIRHKDGRWRFLEGVFTNLLQDAAVGGIVNNFRDITERKETEAELRVWKNRYQTTIRASGLLLYDWDAATDAVTWDGDSERLLGYAPEAMGGLAFWLERIHPDDRAAFDQQLKRVLAEKISFHLHYRVRRKDGACVVVQDDGHWQFDAQGNITRMVGFVADVTARNLAEEKIGQQLEELQRWYRLTLGREQRVQELKREVNELLRQAGQPVRYPSQETPKV